MENFQIVDTNEIYKTAQELVNVKVADTVEEAKLNAFERKLERLINTTQVTEYPVYGWDKSAPKAEKVSYNKPHKIKTFKKNGKGKRLYRKVKTFYSEYEVMQFRMGTELRFNLKTALEMSLVAIRNKHQIHPDVVNKIATLKGIRKLKPVNQ